MVAVALAVPSQAQIHVGPTALGTGDGTTWPNRMGSLSQGLSQASTGQTVMERTVWVMQGSYAPSVLGERVAGDVRSRSFVIAKKVELYGGFAGSETSFNSRVGLFRQTVLTGDLGSGLGRAYNVIECSNVTVGTLDKKSIIDGFQITQGSADGPLFPSAGNPAVGVSRFKFQRGGAIYAGSESQDGGTGLAVIVRNCLIGGNFATGAGGAIYASGDKSDAWMGIFKCFFQANRSDSIGGAVAMFEMASRDEFTEVLSSHIYNSTFEFNLAGTGTDQASLNSQYGGAIAISPRAGDAPTIYNCLLHDNFVRGRGSAIAIFGGSFPTLPNFDVNVSNCTISNNGVLASPNAPGTSIMGPGGTFYLGADSELTLSNSIVWGNSDMNAVKPFLMETGAALSANYCDIEATVSSGAFSGSGNICLDPQFVSASNYRLQATSPCIDKACDAGCPGVFLGSDPGVQPDYPQGFRTVLTPYEYDWTLTLPRTVDIPGISNPFGATDMGCYEVQ